LRYFTPSQSSPPEEDQDKSDEESIIYAKSGYQYTALMDFVNKNAIRWSQQASESKG